MDEEDVAFKEKQKAGQLPSYRVSMLYTNCAYTDTRLDAKAKAELAAMAKGSKGPLNTGSQGIKKSGKK